LRLIRLCLALSVVLIGGILASRVLGMAQANPVATLFTNPDGSPCRMPCLFGVRPGEMTLEEGLKILDQHPLTHRMTARYSDLGVVVFSKEAWINFAIGNSKQIAAIDLAYHVGDSGDSTPELASAIQHAVPGNQVLYFGRPPDNVLKSIKPPYVYERCYATNTICFANQQQTYTDPWQSEPWLGVDVFRQPDN